MGSIGKYLLSLVAAAIVSSVLITLCGRNKSCGGIIKMLCGIFMALTMVSPLAKIQLQQIDSYLGSIEMDANEITGAAVYNAENETAAIIKQELESYILDKAESMNVQLSVTITLGDGVLPQPTAVRLEGSVSPYNRQILEQFIERDLGIPEAQQQWN